MDLGRPRVDLGRFPTPLHNAELVRARLGLDELLIKRDDLTGFGWGGNKVRTVEYLLGDIIDVGATHVLLAAGPSSNFAATMANGARRHRLELEQFAYGSEPTPAPPALLASRRHGAVVHFTDSEDRNSMEQLMVDRGRRLEAAGATPYLVPRGGASEVGAFGFAAAAGELHEQLQATGFAPAQIVMPVGSGGSIAGLLAGQALLGVAGPAAAGPVIGVAVSRSVDETYEVVHQLARRCAAALGLSSDQVDQGSFTIVDGRGAGFGLSSPDETELAIAIEGDSGILVDPVYSAKALRWLADNDVPGPVLYWHTGGSLGVVDRLSAPVHEPT